MVTHLTAGGTVSLTQLAGPRGLTPLIVGVGWDVPAGPQPPVDVNASAIIVDRARTVVDEEDFVFYGNLRNPSGSVSHSGDNAVRRPDGDVEKLWVELFDLPPDADSILVTLSIHDADRSGATFSSVTNVVVRVARESDGEELVRFELPTGPGSESDAANCLVIGEFYRRAREWKFRALNDVYPGGFAGTLRQFGLSV